MTGITAPDPAPGSARARWTRRIITWTILVLLFLALFKLAPSQEVLDEFRKLEPGVILRLMALCLLFIAGVCLIDAAALCFAYRRLSAEIRYGPTLAIRAVTMVLASFVNLIGHAGIAAHLARKHRLPPEKAGGMLIILIFLEIFGMIAVSSLSLIVLGLLPGGMEQAREGPIEMVIVFNLAAAGAFLAAVIAGRKLRPGPLLQKLRLAGAIEPLRLLGTTGIAIILGIKTLLAAWQIFLVHYALLIYGVKIHPADLFTIMPVVIVVSSIPITPARLGTTQFAWTFFFHHLLPAPLLVAFSLLLQFLLNLARWAIGAAALPFIYREMTSPPDKPKA